MKKIIDIKYNSIFKYEEYKEIVKYKEIGTYETTDRGTCIKFKNREVEIQVLIQRDTIWLTNNHATLQLTLGKRIKNTYATMYGDIYIDTFLESFEDNGNIKIKYALFDQEQCISNAYILIHITTLEIVNENT